MKIHATLTLRRRSYKTSLIITLRYLVASYRRRAMQGLVSHVIVTHLHSQSVKKMSGFSFQYRNYLVNTVILSILKAEEFVHILGLNRIWSDSKKIFVCSLAMLSRKTVGIYSSIKNVTNRGKILLFKSFHCVRCLNGFSFTATMYERIFPLYKKDGRYSHCLSFELDSI